MWAIKVLNGGNAGKIFQIPIGKHTIGRSQRANIRIDSTSISKIHAMILVTEDKVIISDQRSSNGVYVNGVKVQNKIIKPGDKFALSDIIFDVIRLPKYASLLPSVRGTESPQSIGSSALAPIPAPNAEIAPYEYDSPQALATAVPQDPDKLRRQTMTIQEKAEAYIDEVALPGVYEFSNKFDMKYVVLTFVGLYILIVTILSVIPVISISRDFVVEESSRRAESLARLLVQVNRQYLISNNEINVSVSDVENKPGVEKAFIIDAADGHIVAPVKDRGRFSKIPFLQEARKKNARYIKLMDNEIGVSIPIVHHNPMTGEPSPIAFAMIIYNLDQVALDPRKAVSLVIQILLITLIAGGILYFFLYKVITKPIFDLNKEMDVALRESKQNIEIDSPTPIFQRLVANINSALSRMSQESNSGPAVSLGDKAMEASEVVQMFPVAAMAISADTEAFLALNDFINGHPLFDDSNLVDKYLDDLTDPSLIESLRDLLQKANDNPNQRHSNTLPTQDGEKFDVTIKSIQDMGSTVYYIICFTEIYDEEGYDE
ncbi:MAG: FHA domain-containing protein [Bdellovibrionales bacterium]|nr:FHA domain-containing protein [Bdellovibrionales bacterium]